MAIEDSQPPTSARAYRNGVMLLLIGIILFFALDQLVPERISLFGLIPAAIGVANLLYGVLLQRKENEDKAQRSSGLR